MLEELAVATLLGKAMGIAANVVIERFTNEQIDILKRTLLNGAETEDAITLPQHYNAYIVRKFCEKEKSSLVSEEALSQESVYIDAYSDAYSVESGEKILDTIEEWSEEESSGVMLIHGEPGHGKTTLCRKAVYEHYLERFCKDKTNVFWFRLNPAYSDIIKDGELVLENAFCWGNIKSQRKMIPLEENKEAYRGSIIFLDGYDELKVQAKSRLRDFIDTVEEYSEEYQIYFVITARTRSVKYELYGLGIPTLQFAPMTEDQQIDWIHKRNELHEYEEEFVKLRESSKEMEEMLGIPILFRMVVKEKLESTAAQNVVGLYDTLFEATMKRRKMKSESREDWHKKYEQLAYEIYCNDDTFADVQKMDMPEEFLYMFHLKGEGKQHVEFLHRSFYQYFLAHFLYRKMSVIEDEESAAAFLCCLAERQIDYDVLNYIQQIQKGKQQVTQDKCEQIINTLEQTGTIIGQALKAPNENGDAEKHSLVRCENVLINALTICCMIAEIARNAFTISLHEKENIHTAMRRYNCSGIWLNNVDLSGANLINADLSITNLNGANLTGTNLNGADLEEAGLTGTDLTGTKLDGADLSRADLSVANLRGADLRGADLRWTKNLDQCDCERVYCWRGCKILLRDKDNLGLKDPDAYGIIWCDDETGDPIKP